MKRFLAVSQIPILASILLTSCLGSKFLKVNEQLLVQTEINGISRSLKDESNALIELKPNSRPFGALKKTPLGFTVIPFTHLTHIYQLGKNGTFFARGFDKSRVEEQRIEDQAEFEKKIEEANNEKKKQRLRNRMVKTLDRRDRKIRQGNQLMRWGEELAVYNHNQAVLDGNKVKLYLNSRGYFNSKVETDTTLLNKKKKTIALRYNVSPGMHYEIDSIQYMVEDTVLKKLITENLEKAPLKKGFYDQKTLTEERDYIYNLAVNNGYFEFSRQYITFEIDSIQLGDNKLFVRERIRNPVDKSKHKIFYIDSIVFVSNASITRSFQRSIEKYKGITFNFGKNRYSPKVLEWRIPLEQDDRYSRDLTIETQRQLSYLDNFKFVNINYDTTNNHFVANIFTSPFDKYQTSNEFGFTQNSNAQRLGPFFNLSLKNRNTFRALEIIGIDLNAKLEGISGVTETDEKYSSRQFGGQLSFSFPQFLFPLGGYYKKKMGSFNPKTRMLIGVSYEDRINEYERRTIQSSLAYSWQVRDQLKYTLTPVQISLIQSTNSDAFENFLQDLEDQGNTYANAFRSAFVSTTSFQLDLNLGQYSQGNDGGFVRFFAEIGGDLNNFLGETAFGDTIEVYQFVKTNIDLRKIERITRKLNLAYRLNVGLAYAYGSNNSLPYEKYFFGGGSNSIRAWKPRRLGPGAYGVINELNEVDFTREQPGDLLIQTSLELRQKLVGFLEGAFFIDAGNIWLIKGSSVDPSTDPEGDDGKFRINEFINEMAVGTGLGFRFDLSFLILRLDMGIKLFDPARPPGKRFVGDQIFRNFAPNSEFNIGIGYPF
ncbi:MAG: BamA/TamA family outer membrane protein [Cyclobacteriaceae bacterium]